MKILVVEDDAIVVQTLQILFSSYNYAVDIAADGEAGLQMAEAFEYDLIVLDIGLPKLDGVSLCQKLRQQGVQQPILLLTGQGSGRQKANALNSGADDYVVKPFDAEELIARVQALLRRGRSTSQPILTWGNLSIDPSSHQVNYGNELMSLTPKEYAILELLLRHPQTVFSASAILERVWNSIESPGEETVRTHIKELRQKLQAVGASKDFVKTIYQMGYQLNPLYSSGGDDAVDAAQPTTPQIAELTAVNQELRGVLEQVRQEKQELEIAYQKIAQEKQQLQTAANELAQRLTESTVNLDLSNRRLQQQYLHQQNKLWG
jgi:DNA-binding response OmpR family regulator